jgi:regulator of RNase E activity RraA
MAAQLTSEQAEFLRLIDTPTVRRGSGYTIQHLHCPFVDLPPMVGFAKTVTFRAREPHGMDCAGYMAKRLDYLDYVASEPSPAVMIMQDLDDPPGHGAFWGEVQSNVHKALGALGVVTNGSVRDIPAIAPGFQMLAGSIGPSHAHVHVVDFGVAVEVHGMSVSSGDLIHADRHGAVVVPIATIGAMKTALDKLLQQEARIIEAARAPGANVATIKQAIRGS